jgi:hypothetical protein
MEGEGSSRIQMRLFTQVQHGSEALGCLAELRAQNLELQCAEMGIASRDARLVVMWGGGKDSTLALILATAVSDLTGCSVRAITMVHPGLTAGTLANIEHIVQALRVRHEWRQFLRILPAADAPGDQWAQLYSRLAQATAFHPRFMCVGCNLGSVVTEYQAIADVNAHFRVTGNSGTELDKFDEWAAALRRQFAGNVIFPVSTGRPFLDYYRLWWAIYKELLTELRTFGGFGQQAPECGELAISEYLYDLPSEHDAAAATRVFSVLEDEAVSYTIADYSSLLSLLGWRLPEDIQGGTESDCAMPAAITTIDIQRHGLPKHIEHLNYAAEVLRPLPEMYNRALIWIRSGRSLEEGRETLRRIGIPDELPAAIGPGTPVAMALAGQLLPVR